MPLPMLLAGLGSAAGAAGGAFNTWQAQQEADKVKKQNALEAKYSPWVKPDIQKVPQTPSMIGQAVGGGLTGGLAGAQIGGGISKAFKPDIAEPQETMGAWGGQRATVLGNLGRMAQGKPIGGPQVAQVKTPEEDDDRYSFVKYMGR